MKILVIGGCHTYGCGIQLSAGFVQLLDQKLRIFGHDVWVDFYAPFKMGHFAQLLAIKPNLCSEYGLIIWQLGNYELQTAGHFKGLFKNLPNLNDHLYGGSRVVTSVPSDIRTYPAAVPVIAPASQTEHVRNFAKHVVLRIADFANRITRFKTLRQELKNLLELTQNYREKIIVLTPFPKPGCSVDNYLRTRGAAIFREECRKAKFELVDIFGVATHKRHFLADESHLNETGHRLLKEAIENTETFKREIRL